MVVVFFCVFLGGGGVKFRFYSLSFQFCVVVFYTILVRLFIFMLSDLFYALYVILCYFVFYFMLFYFVLLGQVWWWCYSRDCRSLKSLTDPVGIWVLEYPNPQLFSAYLLTSH